MRIMAQQQCEKSIAIAPLTGGKPLLPGESDIDQLGLVGRLYGGLTPQQWPGITAAPDYGETGTSVGGMINSLICSGHPLQACWQLLHVPSTDSES